MIPVSSQRPVPNVAVSLRRDEPSGVVGERGTADLATAGAIWGDGRLVSEGAAEEGSSRGA